ncbi:hypothetical protein CBQ28_17055 [Pseudoalteromonas sp. GCY]|uniref:hypothetical protein n=1 Tax=Pseudoalteromonas sp. GCY TaxID=2003316 RepID=UPI000BFEC617|nr:hypothetical protein [Pseudoalteromonas sp. GCY]PHI35972.1 hypothetical protein CBQ28_17055 [Pseudoalteromonas sp. GCY]QQQ68548.1 hypothetical protein JJQ94_12450 [Pseudoalteromonas sp. GCY]
MLDKQSFLSQYDELIEKELNETIEIIEKSLTKEGFFSGNITFEKHVPYGVAKKVMEEVEKHVKSEAWSISYNNEVGKNFFAVEVS